MNNCIFCKIVRGEIPTEKIYENDNFFSVPDAYPVFEGHTLVISKKHFDTILDLPSSLGTDLLDAIKKTTLKVIEQFNAEGVNVNNNFKEAAGQIVNHFHVHIIPRKKADNAIIKFIDKDSKESVELRDKGSLK